MNRRCFAAVIIILFCNYSLRAATPQQVDESVKKAVAWLYSKQKDGTWEEKPACEAEGKVWSVTGGQWGGLTGLATYALLAAGESLQDERLVKSIEFLKKADLVGTYALATSAACAPAATRTWSSASRRRRPTRPSPSRAFSTPATGTPSPAAGGAWRTSCSTAAWT